MAQWIKWSLPTPEILDLNPVIGKFYLQSTVLKTALKGQKHEKEAKNGPIKNISSCLN